MAQLNYSEPPAATGITSVKEDNKLRATDRAAHDWYRFVLSYPPHLVRSYVDRFGFGPHSRVLDPFCGTGTTLVECKKLGVPSVGIESNLSTRHQVGLQSELCGDRGRRPSHEHLSL